MLHFRFLPQAQALHSVPNAVAPILTSCRMKIELWAVGKTDEGYLQTGLDDYHKRLQRYTAYEAITIPNLKNRKKLTTDQIKTQEGDLILTRLQKSDYLILLDERGKALTSLQFAQQLERWSTQGHKRLIFLIGGAYGFSPAVYAAAHTRLSLSAMTFSHQMVRLFFTEQLYRAYTILNGEPYHHE